MAIDIEAPAGEEAALKAVLRDLVLAADDTAAEANGNNVAITAGAGGATSGEGGDITITAGDAPTDGSGGAVAIMAGGAQTVGDGGAVTIASGVGGVTSGHGGAVTLLTSTAQAVGNGGTLTLTAGAGGATSGDGGAIAIIAGSAQDGDGNGGNITLTPGSGNGSGTDGVVTAPTAPANTNTTQVATTEFAHAEKAWKLVNSWTYSENVTEVLFTGLSLYTDLLIITRLMTKDVSGVTAVQLSVDNGATYLSASGDYKSITAAGGEGDLTAVTIHDSSSTAARSAPITILGSNLNGAPKLMLNSLRANNGNVALFTGSLSPVNAVRIFPHNGGNWTGGTIHVLGR